MQPGTARTAIFSLVARTSRGGQGVPDTGRRQLFDFDSARILFGYSLTSRDGRGPDAHWLRPCYEVSFKDYNTLKYNQRFFFGLGTWTVSSVTSLVTGAVITAFCARWLVGTKTSHTRFVACVLPLLFQDAP